MKNSIKKTLTGIVVSLALTFGAGSVYANINNADVNNPKQTVQKRKVFDGTYDFKGFIKGLDNKLKYVEFIRTGGKFSDKPGRMWEENVKYEDYDFKQNLLKIYDAPPVLNAWDEYLDMNIDLEADSHEKRLGIFGRDAEIPLEESQKEFDYHVKHILRLKKEKKLTEKDFRFAENIFKKGLWDMWEDLYIWNKYIREEIER